MRKPYESRGLLFGQKNKRDDRGSAIVIVIIAMALIGILASTILWASYLNYRIKVNDLKVKNSFYSAETVVEQIMAGVKKEIVSASVNEAYQEVVSNWDALGTDANRESFFLMEYNDQVKKRLNYDEGTGWYDRDILKDYVDDEFWIEDNANGFIVESTWEDESETPPEFRTFEDNQKPDPSDPGGAKTSNGMTIKNVCVEFYDNNGLLSIINTDIAIDVPRLRFTQAGTIDRLYPYVFVGDEGIVVEDYAVNINGSIYGGVNDENEGGIKIKGNGRVLLEDASYIISGGGIVLGDGTSTAELIVRDATTGGYKANVYAQDLEVNSGYLSITGRMYVADDLILSGKDSSVSLSGQYLGYGQSFATSKPNGKVDDAGRPLYDNPAEDSSAIVINGKDSTVDLTGLNTLLLAGRAYVSMSDDENENAAALPHILMGESISVKSNQIAYLVPPECVGTVDREGTSDTTTVIGQNPVPIDKWGEMIGSLSGYTDAGQTFRIVDATKAATKLGGGTLGEYGIRSIEASGLNLDPDNIPQALEQLKTVAEESGIRFLYLPRTRQVYLYLVMSKDNAEKYFAAYYNVNSNRTSLDNYFNQYASGGIRLKENVQGYTVVGNSMVSLTSAGSGDNILTSNDGENLVRLLSSVEFPTGEEGDEDEEDDQPTDPDAYEEVSDNITSIENIRTQAELDAVIDECEIVYENLNRNLTEDNTGFYNTVFDNLVNREELNDYLDERAPFTNKVEFTSNGQKAVLARGTYDVSALDSDLRLLVVDGDVNVKSSFQGLIIASGTITVASNVTCKKDGEGVYNVLQAPSQFAETDDDENVPANFLENGSGMVESGYEDVETDELGNVSLDYSRIVRYENWIKK